MQVTRIYTPGRSDCGYLEVRDPRSNSTQEYRLFDHVTVSIHVSESVAHGLGLRLQLLTGPRRHSLSVIGSDNLGIPSSTLDQEKAVLVEVGR